MATLLPVGGERYPVATRPEGFAATASVNATRRLAAIVAADVVGYSRLMGLDEPGTLAALKAHRAAIDPLFAARGGRIVKTTGDGLLLEFASVVDAVAAAIDAQRAVAERNKDVPADRRIAFRMGINVGDIVIDGDDIFGDGVNVAARIEALARPGGICITDRVREDLQGRLAFACEDMGEQTLKNIARPVRVLRLDPTGETNVAPSPAPTRSRRLRYVAGAIALGLVCSALAGAWLLSWRQPAPVESAARSAPLVAVLPFVNQSGDPAQEYFSDGLTEDVIAALGRFTSLAVLARNAIMPLKGQPTGVDAAVRTLGARYVVEGSVLRVGDRVRVQAKLIDAQGSRVMWTDRFDGDAKNLFQLQDELVQQIAGTLASQVGRMEQDRARQRPTQSLDAYDLTLRGRAQLDRGTRASYVEARGFFERALAIDPNYADAHLGLALVHYFYVQYGHAEAPGEAIRQAEELVREALRGDPGHAQAHGLLGRLLTLSGRYEDALAAIDRALAINPSDAENQYARAAVLMWSGRLDEARLASALAQRLEPLRMQPERLFNVALLELLRGEPQRARAVLEPHVDETPRSRTLHVVLAIAYAQSGRAEEALRSVAVVKRLDPFFDASRFGMRLRDPAHRQMLADGLRKAGLRSD